jgi:2-dehydrotetronate isomerase
MPRFAANLAYLFTERPLIERFAAAAAAGFRAIELQLPYDHAPSAVRAELERHGLTVLGVNTAPGQSAVGEFGVAAVPGREQEFAAVFKQALDYITAIGGCQIHCLAGRVPPEQRPAAEMTFVRNLTWAADAAREKNVTVLIEPINPRDRPDYFSPAPNTRPISSPRWSGRTCASSSTSIMPRSSAAIWSSASKSTCRWSGMCRSRLCRRGTNRTKAK